MGGEGGLCSLQARREVVGTCCLARVVGVRARTDLLLHNRNSGRGVRIDAIHSISTPPANQQTMTSLLSAPRLHLPLLLPLLTLLLPLLPLPFLLLLLLLVQGTVDCDTGAVVLDFEAQFLCGVSQGRGNGPFPFQMQ